MSSGFPEILSNIQLADQAQLASLLENTTALDASSISSKGVKRLTFRAVVPDECVKGDSTIGINFYLHRTGNFQLLNIECSVQLEKVATVNKQSLRVYLIEARLPVLPNNNGVGATTTSYCYHYYLRSATETGSRHETVRESLLIEQRQMRQSSIPNVSFDGRYSRREDGLVHFGNLSSAKESALKGLVLNVIVQFDILNTRHILGVAKHAEFLDSLTLVWRYLCLYDNIYREAFEQLLEKEFLKIAEQIGQRPEYDRQILLALITMFYCTYAFDMKLFNEPTWHDYLFGCHQLSNHSLTYFSNLNRFFQDAERAMLNNGLERFLAKNSTDFKLVNGINAVVLYYYLNKSTKSPEFHDKLFGFSVDFKGNDHKLRNADAYFRAYTSYTFSVDMPLCLFVIAYFTSKEPQLLKGLLKDYLFPVEFLVNVLKAYLAQPSIKRYAKEIFQIVVEHLVEISNEKYMVRFTELSRQKHLFVRSPSLDKRNSPFSSSSRGGQTDSTLLVSDADLLLVKDLKNETLFLLEFLDHAISNNTGDTERIVQVLSICLKYVNLEQTAMVGKISHQESEYSQLISLVRRWLLSRFNAPLWVNYGLRLRGTSSDGSRSAEPMVVDDRFSVEGGVGVKVNPLRSYDFRDEPEVYGELFSLESFDLEGERTDLVLSSFKRDVMDILKSRLEAQINQHFQNFLAVRQEHNFDRFGNNVRGYTRSEFIQKFDDTICSYLVRTDSFENFVTLCDTLREVKYQELLWAYTNSLFEAKKVADDFEFMLKWTNFSSICKFNYQTSNPSKPISPKWSSKILAKLRVFATTAINVIQGHESLFIIKILSKNIKSAIRLLKVITDHLGQHISLTTLDSNSVRDFEKLVAFRMKEVHEFEKYRANLVQLLPFCHLFNQIDTTRVERELTRLAQHADLDQQAKLSQFVRAMPLSEVRVADLNSYVPTVTYFQNIDQAIMSGIEQIIKLDRAHCVLFDDFFNQACNMVVKGRQEPDRRLDCKSVIELAWPRALQEWQQLAEQFNVGRITLADLEAFLEKYFNGEFKRMLQEFTYWLSYLRIGNLNERSSQIELYGRFRSLISTAKVVQDIRGRLGISDEFHELDDFLSLDEQTRSEWTIVRMTGQIRRTVDALDTINSQDKLNCIYAFVESMNLVDWLRQNSKSLVELKVFVELILSSAENNDSKRLQFAKILKEAGTAYTSFIYSLDSNCGFNKFIDLSKQVMSYLDIDKNIAEKLKLVNEQIGLLEQIKNMRGNVETNALTLTKLFNAVGTYTLGRSSRSERKLERQLKREDVIELEVELESGKVKRYSYEQLKEHQSVLMLIASRKTTTDSPLDEDQSDREDEFSVQLDHFVSLFEAVCRTATAYVDLVNSGCSLFKGYAITIQSRFNAAHATQNSSSIEDTGRLRLKTGPDSSEYLDRICGLMNECLELWNKYIDALRNEYAHLNYFTMNQIEFLKTEIGQLLRGPGDARNLSLVKDLLHYFCNTSSLSIDEIRAAFDASMSQSEQHRFDHSKFQNLSALRVQQDTAASAENDHYIHDTFSRRWRQFMENQELFNPDNSMDVDNGAEISAALTIEGLAVLFRTLENSQQQLQRRFRRAIPDYLVHRGKPNLIMCSNEKAQIPIVLSIYAQSSNQTPLPSDDEVLYCSATTTHEQVENFIRVAYKSTGDKIYTLVNAQELTYETSGRLEQFLSNNMGLHKSKTKEFVFVCICCQNAAQSQSIFSLMFSKNKVKPIELSMSDLEEYVNSQLSLPGQLRGALGLNESSTSVRALLSYSSGNGKSSYVAEQLKKMEQSLARPILFKTIRIKSLAIDIEQEANKLIEFKSQLAAQRQDKDDDDRSPVVYHIDIAFETFKNVDVFLFDLVIGGCLRNSTNGLLWRRDPHRDMFFIEMTTPYLTKKNKESDTMVAYHAMINYLPKINFNTPARYQYHAKNIETPAQDNMFSRIYTNANVQRTCFYLTAVDESIGLRERAATLVDQVDRKTMIEESYKRLNVRFQSDADVAVTSETKCLDMLLKSIQNASCSWMEISNFVRFLDTNIEILEKAAQINQVPYLRGVLLHFLVIMARDFSLSSLQISDDDDEEMDVNENLLPPNLARQSSRTAFDIASDSEVLFASSRLETKSNKKWENMIHPLLIFNADKTTMTFMGCYVDRSSRKFINPATGRPIEESYQDFPDLSAPGLYAKLVEQKINLFDNFNDQHQTSKVRILCKVLGVRDTHTMYKAIDANYMLTVDNCLKLMAIYLRFKCNNPVVVSGETGCGKTSLVKFFADLYLYSLSNPTNPANGGIKEFLVHAKIHGGTTASDIKEALHKAVQLSVTNSQIMGAQYPITAVLFFDEANTTEAVGLIKEIMCDQTCDGERIDLAHGLKIVAAVNPYRKHSDQMIEKLEQAGLGFYVSADSTKEKLGHIPMRHLVYRVQPLPSSLIPLVWDFGQLEKSVESVYIKQMVEKAYREMVGALNATEVNAICLLLTESQKFMRDRDDECSFVSLRNIQRALDVAKWFFSKKELIFDRMNGKLEKKELFHFNFLSNSMRSVALSLAVTYHAGLYTLETRQEYRRLVCSLITSVDVEDDWFNEEILACQTVFFDSIAMDKKNIARNGALLENVFMMVVCIELRIPLFIVGKPGSSKSLAKSIVAGAMEGINSKSALFQNLKETYFVNFQCSPLTTSDMIVKAFKEAARFQESNNLDTSVAVVNLDEIGLAEGSEAMPLKALHSLLEEGVSLQDDQEPNGPQGVERRRVAVVGISNWALDPAKMNRGIMVSRGEPDIKELEETARGICSSDPETAAAIQPYLAEIAAAYLEICQLARDFKREFYGLRDYYSLIKMLYCFCSADRQFTWCKLEHAVKRNFGGLEINVLAPFATRLPELTQNQRERLESDPKSGPVDLIRSALKSEHMQSNSRYLLFITENETAIDIIQSYLINKIGVNRQDLTVIFGSSFRQDQQFSEICRNISIIKNSMEMGKTVILLNSYNLYESLYDALNQYYSEFAGQKYVDLGLGTNRVKCMVHPNFRLIMIAEKAAAYDSKRFPIPLVNRLEKHFINSSTMIDSVQQAMVAELDQWVNQFCRSVTPQGHSLLSANQVFVGWDADTKATLVMHLTQHEASLIESGQQNAAERRELDQREVIRKAQMLLLRCATADSIVRLSSDSNRFMESDQKEKIWKEYFHDQGHLSLSELLIGHMHQFYAPTPSTHTVSAIQNSLLQVTTHSQSSVLNLNTKLLSIQLDMRQDDSRKRIDTCLLKAFDTQQQFVNRLRGFLQLQQENASRIDEDVHTPSLMIIQCDMNNKKDLDLITCARHTIVEETKAYLEQPDASKCFLVILVLSIPREHTRKFIGFQVTHWSCYHLDELDDSAGEIPSLEVLKQKSIVELISQSYQHLTTTTSLPEQTLMRSFSIRLLRTKSQIEREKQHLSIGNLLKRIGCNACSLIVDTNMSRTIMRTGLFVKLCDNFDFLKLITVRLLQLLEQKEKEYEAQSQQWLVKEAASLKNMNDFSTLRRSCQSYFEAKLSPLLAYILSSIDVHGNMDIFVESLEEAAGQAVSTSWKASLWLSMLESKELCDINYLGMRVRVGENDQEQRNFSCKSQLLKVRFSDQINLNDENAHLRPRLPFSWLVVKLITNLNSMLSQTTTSRHVLERLLNKEAILAHSQGLSELVASTSLSEMLRALSDRCQQESLLAEFIDCYINDLVLTKCKLNNNQEFVCVKKVIRSAFNETLAHLPEHESLEQQNNLIWSMSIVHYIFETLEDRLETFLTITSQDPRVLSDPLFEQETYYSLRSTSSYLNIDLDACEVCIQNFKSGFRLDQTSVATLCQLLQLIDKVMANNESIKYQSDHRLSYHNSLALSYKRFSILRYFIDIVVSSAISHPDSGSSFEQLIKRIFDHHFKHEFNLKTKATLQVLLEFMQESKETLRSVNIENIDVKLSQFYSNVLVNFCFNRGAEMPETDAVELVLTQATQDSSPISANPLVASHRPLILQIIFQDHRQLVKSHVKHIMDGNQLATGGVFKSAVEIALFYQNCVQDSYYQQSKRRSMNENLREASQLLQADSFRKYLPFDKIFKKLKNRGVTFDVDALDFLSVIKYCLSLLADVCFVILSRNDTALFKCFEFELFNATLKEMLESSLAHTDTLYSYLSRHIVRKYGSTYIKLIRLEETLKWMAPDSLVGDMELASNNYVLGGDLYDHCEKAVILTFQSNNSKYTTDALSSDPSLLPYMAMSFYRNVTSLHTSSHSIDRIRSIFDEVVKSNKSKVDFDALVHNKFTHNLKVSRETMDEIELSSLLVQLKYCLVFSKSGLANSLAQLIEKPASMNNSYLPTLPQDEFYDIKAALHGKNHENTTFYTCPNGHTYTIGNCGRPWETSTCNECGAAIGGTSHNLISDNKNIDETVVDNTPKGYCLPPASELPNTLTMDRLLNIEAFHTVRFFLHASLYLACGDDDRHKEDVKSLFTGKKKPDDCKEFFWAQIKKDIRLIAEALKITEDEVMLLLHRCCFNIVKYSNNEDSVPRKGEKSYGAWLSKGDRRDWEFGFYKTFLSQLFNTLPDVIAHANNQIKKQAANSDKTKSKFYMVAWELIETDPEKLQYLYETEKFWKFRPHITFATLKNALKTTQPSQYLTLKSFIGSIDELEGLVQLPDIVKLVTMLQANFNKTLFRQNARNVSIAKFLLTSNFQLSTDQVEGLIDSLNKTWQRVKPYLNKYVTTVMRKSLRPDMLKSSFAFDGSTALSFFLPTLYGDGFACYALLRYLSATQNNLIESFNELKKVNFEELVSEELVVQFDREKQQIPLLQMNAFVNPETMQPEFDYSNIESQVVHKFIRAKAVVNMETIPSFEYSDEMKDYGIFEQLESTVQQESFDETTQLEIFNEFTKTNDISEALSYLKIIMNFAYTTRAGHDEFIGKFLNQIFVDENSLKSAEAALKYKITETCRLKHLKHAFILLSTKRALLLTQNDQDPFENINLVFKADDSIAWSYNLDSLQLVSTMIIIYQIIHLKIVNFDDQDLLTYSSWNVQFIFSSLDDLGKNVIKAESISRLPLNFPDPETVPSGAAAGEPIKMKDIFTFWKTLVRSYRSA